MKQMRYFLIGMVGFIFFFLVFAFPLGAQDADEVKGTIIFDFTGKKENETPLAYVFGGKSIDTIASQLGVKVDDILKGNTETKSFLENLKKKYRKTGNRWISRENDLLEVFIFYRQANKEKESSPGEDSKGANPGGEAREGKKPEIKFEEMPRKTQFAKDITQLVKMVLVLGMKGEVTGIEVGRSTYRLTERRALLSVSAAWQKKEKKVEMITGPREHWFLSADLPVTKLSDVKFVSDPGTLEPKETPKHFYLGVNVMVGDILAGRQNLSKNFFLKGMLKISKSPLDSYGIGIGYRFPNVRVIGVDISSFSVFASLIWSKEGTEGENNGLKKRQFLFGVSYNLDKAMGWIK